MASSEDRARLMEGGELEPHGDAVWGDQPSFNSSSQPLRSQYSLTRNEATRSLANRLIHSRAYIFFYLGMTALSITTVVLSLVKGCPGVSFYVLEVIVNSAMIAEVSIRMIALSKQFWKSIFNWLDLGVTIFCVLTLLVIFMNTCSSKGEEVFDTLVLIARNVLQFFRLAAIMRKSGTSIFSRPKPIDLSRSRAQDIDMSDDDDELADYETSRAQNVLFDART